MVIKNGSTLSKDYFKSYFKLRMNTLGCTLVEAREQTNSEFFSENADRFGEETYNNFCSAYKEMKEKQE
ncbi:hypothetical protein [Virgibacillus sp. DJP39]|uniref:hypothetical protein n=1 Tax=Virgibacillus sp. DJP39 TaxID=3409790 RepID=UPI003BB68D2D